MIHEDLSEERSFMHIFQKIIKSFRKLPIALKVQKAMGSVTITNDISKVYDGSAVNDITYTALSKGCLLYTSHWKNVRCKCKVSFGD